MLIGKFFGVSFIIRTCMLINFAGSEIFTSMDYIYSAIRDSELISNTLDEYIINEEKRLNSLKQFAEYLKELQKRLLVDGEEWAGNPISAYRFAKVYAEDWDSEFTKYIENAQPEMLDHILSSKETLLPGKEDLEGVTDGLARLQGTYLISAEEIANGTIQGFSTGELTVAECYDIGQHMYERTFAKLSAEWFDVAIKKHGRETNGQTTSTCQNKPCQLTEEETGVSISNIIQAKESATEKFEQQKKNLTEDLEAVVRRVSELAGELAVSVREEIMEQQKEGELLFYGKELLRNTRTKRLYERLCREDVVFRSHDPSLICSYFTDDNPILLIQPGKVEVLSWSPYIVIFHDIITDKEIDSLKRSTYEHLERAQGIPKDPKKSGDGREMDERISRYYYLTDDHPTVDRIYTRVEALTGLLSRLPSAEILQVGNYGVGGQYEPHYDFFDENQIDTLTSYKSNRLATLLFYLSDVAAGGATVFPDINLRIPVKRGSAAFWLNLDMDLQGDTNTFHAGCPVLMGSKWVANKWIHTYNQNLKCLLA